MAHQTVDTTAPANTTTSTTPSAADSNLEGTSPRSTILVGASPVSTAAGATNRNMSDDSSPEKGGVTTTTVVPQDSSSATQATEDTTTSSSRNNSEHNKTTATTAGSAGTAAETAATTADANDHKAVETTGTGANGTATSDDTTSLSPPPNHPSATVVAAGQGAFYGYPPPASSFLLPGANPSPVSPPRPMATPGGGVPPPPPQHVVAQIPPASPIFPRLNSGNQAAVLAATTSNATDSFAATYPTYSTMVAAPGSPQDSASAGWNAGVEGSSQPPPPPPAASPQVHSQGMPMPYGIAGGTGSNKGRAYSFEDTMLTPAATTSVSDGSQDGGAAATMHANLQTGNPAYSPYGGSTASTGSTLFATAQAQWPYGTNAVPDMYNTTPPSPLQPRPSPHMAPHPMHPHAHHHGPPPPPHHHPGNPPPHHHLGYPPPPMGMNMSRMGGGGGGGGGYPYGPHGGFPTSSPGPPIQTTASNKGPDGANLFIFHIPNHFSNLDMYQLFEPYGNLLSVRIMVEKDTGRSRGFGFVSYDSPESAALAIKALNGFAIGNKRLKVQHKQIRPKDMHEREQQQHNGYGPGPGMPHDFGGPSALPPAGPHATSWGPAPNVVHTNANKQDENTELTSQSTGAETPSFGATAATANDTLSPLASLGSLQNALPDVGGTAGGSGNPNGTNDNE